LPLPLSPVTSTVAFDAAARRAASSRLVIAGEAPDTNDGPSPFRSASARWTREPPVEAALDDPPEELEVGRLLQEVRGALADRLDRGLDGAVRRQHHDVGGVPVGLQPLQHLEAGHPRHREVEQHDVELALRRRGERGLAVRRVDGREAPEGEAVRQRAPERRVVVDDERRPLHVRAASDGFHSWRSTTNCAPPPGRFSAETRPSHSST
jgi:hypothetical protein